MEQLIEGEYYRLTRRDDPLEWRIVHIKEVTPTNYRLDVLKSTVRSDLIFDTTNGIDRVYCPEDTHMLNYIERLSEYSAYKLAELPQPHGSPVTPAVTGFSKQADMVLVQSMVTFRKEKLKEEIDKALDERDFEKVKELSDALKVLT